MKLESAYISLSGVRLYAYHGVMPQETVTGGEFIVDLRVGYPICKAMQSDDVADTLSYAELYELVKTEMLRPSKLLEHVVGRIATEIERRYPAVSAIDIKITKVNPPMGASCDGAAVEGHFKG